MKNMTSLAAMAVILGMATPALATMDTRSDTNATQTNPMINQKDSIKVDTSPHANAPASIEAKPPAGAAVMHHTMNRDNLTQAQRDEIAQRKAMRKEKMKNMTPAQREAARKKWEAKRAEYKSMTPEQREAAKAKWDAEHNNAGTTGADMENKDLNKASRQTNINDGVGSSK